VTSPPQPTPPARRRRRDDDDPVLPDVTRDEQDAGWGDDSRRDRRDRADYERERPPHHE
jgi:hypothetical protein